MKFGGDMRRPQGFGQATPQGGGMGYPGAGYGAGPGTGMVQGPGSGPGPGPGSGMPMNGGMPVGGGRYPGGGYPGGTYSGGMYPGGRSQAPGGIPGGVPSESGMLPGGTGMTPGGSIRNTLGAGLKSRGVFQKDGKINNSRGGFFGPKQGGGGGMGSGGPFSFLGQEGGGQAINQPRQLILEPAQAGISANGIATISPDNLFTCIANLPSPNTLTGQVNGTYAAYLVDEKGSSGFLAGVLRPVGSGVYQTQFRSQVPLLHYSRVLITVENPQNLGHVPNGPIVLQVKQPMGASRFLNPVKKAGGSVWQKISGFVRGRGTAPVPPSAPSGLGDDLFAPEMVQAVDPTIPPIQQ